MVETASGNLSDSVPIGKNRKTVGNLKFRSGTYIL